MVGTMAAPAIDRKNYPACGGARGFSLVDVLVSLAVISVLIGLLLPTLSGVRETTRQVVCRSNVRQHGFGIALFADDWGNKIPPSSFSVSQPHLTTVARRGDAPDAWEGLGHLFIMDYLPAGAVFYCPSHTGAHPASQYASRWTSTPGSGAVSDREIVTNYQYRGALRSVYGGSFLPDIPARAALVADALRTQGDFNHRIGTNVLRADLSANWYADHGSRLSGALPAGEADPAAASKVRNAWDVLDMPLETLPPAP